SGSNSHSPLADLNGDGLADLVYTSETNIMVAYSTGIGFSSGVTAVAGAAPFAPGDVSGDGRGDLVIGSTVYKGTSPLPDAITKVTDSLLRTIDVTYEPLSTSTAYEAGTGAAWPVRDIRAQVPLYVTASVTAS